MPRNGILFAKRMEPEKEEQHRRLERNSIQYTYKQEGALDERLHKQ